MNNNRLNSLDGFENDVDFLKLKDVYEAPNMYSIIGSTRKEDWHSNIINWMLNPRANHKMGEFPMIKLLELVNKKIDEEKIDVNKIDIEDICIKKIEFEREVKITKGRPDIVGRSDRFILIIENKVDSDEGEYQTDKYFEYYENEEGYRQAKKIYIFLNCRKDKTPNNKKFIHITYQELLDNVISYCLKNNNIDEGAKTILIHYIIAISNPGNQLVIIYKNVAEVIFGKDIAYSLYDEYKELLEEMRTELSKVDRDYNSTICQFYRKNKNYINDCILAPLNIDIIKEANGKDLEGKDLIRTLCEEGIVEPNFSEIRYNGSDATYIVLIEKREGGEYKCKIQYERENKKSEFVNNEKKGTIYFDSVDAAARAAYVKVRKIWDPDYNGNGHEMSPTGKFKLYKAQKSEYNEKTIAEIKEIICENRSNIDS